VGRVATVIVAMTVTVLAVVLAIKGKSIFQVMVTFNTIISLAYGPPALLGLLVKKTPPWSGLTSFLTGLGIGSVASFLLGWGLVMNVVVVVPASITIFLSSRWLDRSESAHVVRREKLFTRLNTPVDVQRELADCPDQTVAVFRFLSRITAAVGVLTLMLLFFVARADRPVVISYAAMTILIAFSLRFIRGRQSMQATKSVVREEVEIHGHA
jgi:hypothetical protein